MMIQVIEFRMNSFTLTRMEYFAQESVPPFIQFSTNEYLPAARNLSVKVHQASTPLQSIWIRHYANYSSLSRTRGSHR
jgi:hypothetical protein